MKNILDPYVSFSQIDIKFELMNIGGVLFANDLGLVSFGINDGNDIGCEYSLGLESLDLSNKLECILIKGPNVPTTADWAIVRIRKFKSLIAGIDGKKIILSIPIINPAGNFYFKKFKKCYFYIKKLWGKHLKYR